MTAMKLRFEPTMPNILTLIRFLAIPVLAYLIYAGDEYNIVAFILFVAIWLTDMLDGYIARRFNQMTEFGKLFDPLVDKLFQLTTAVMMCRCRQAAALGTAFHFRQGAADDHRQFDPPPQKRNWSFLPNGTARWPPSCLSLAFAALFFLPPDQTWLAGYIFILPVAWSLYCLSPLWPDTICAPDQSQKEQQPSNN